MVMSDVLKIKNHRIKRMVFYHFMKALFLLPVIGRLMINGAGPVVSKKSMIQK